MSTPSKPLLMTLVITLILTAWALMQEDDAVVQTALNAQPKGPRHAAPPTSAPALAVSPPISARTLEPMQGNPFASSTMVADDTTEPLAEEPLVPVATPAIEPAAAEPVAAKVPFKYLGSLKQDKRLVYFLTSEDKVFTVAAGERLNKDYELTAVGNDSVTLTYLPLGQAQTLPIEK